jgi:hypothetical protein
MAAKGLQILEAGSIGLFHRWANKGLIKDAPVERGWIARSGGWIHVDTIDEGDLPRSIMQRDGARFDPTALLGQLPNGTVIALEVQDRGGTAVMIGEHVSTQQYRARTVVVDAPLSRLRSSKVRGMRAHFLSLDVFARLPGVQEKWEYSPDSRVTGYQLRLDKDSTERSAPPQRGRKLLLTTVWSVDGPLASRQITVPTSVVVESSRPTSVFEVLRPLMDIQSLIGILHTAFVPAHSVGIVLDLTPDERHPATSDSFPCWSGPLLDGPPDVAVVGSTPWPLLTLADLGGVTGLARWVRLAEEHPRAVGPAIAPVRFGPAVAESDLLTLGAAFEYWVAVHRQARAQWATAKMPKGTSAHRRVLESVSRRAGAPFAQWVVNRAAWCDDFSTSYDKLKHDPSYQIEIDLLHDLVMAGRYLLLGLLADRVALNKTPTRKLFAHHSLSALQSRHESRY